MNAKRLPADVYTIAFALGRASKETRMHGAGEIGHPEGPKAPQRHCGRSRGGSVGGPALGATAMIFAWREESWSCGGMPKSSVDKAIPRRVLRATLLR